MRTLIATFRRVVADLVAGRHLEAYAVAFGAFALAVIGVLDDAVPTDLKIEVILVALSLLVFKTTTAEQKPADLDSVLLDRQSYGPFREFIRGGRELWVYGPSAVNVLRNAPDIKNEILDKGGRVRVLLQDPEEEAGMNILRRQLDKIYSLDDDIKTSLRTLQNMTTWQTSGTFEWGLLPYSPGFSLVVVDPDGRDGRLVIEFYGFQNELITDRMHIVITRQQSQYWFEYWAAQFEKMWATARQPALEG